MLWLEIYTENHINQKNGMYYSCETCYNIFVRMHKNIYSWHKDNSSLYKFYCMICIHIE